MSVTITIGGNDRSDTMDWSSMRIKNRRNQADECSFVIRKKKDSDFKPNLTQEVIVQDGTTKIFAGIIVKIRDRVRKRKLQEYEVECIDYTRYLWRRRIPDTFADKTVNTIISSLVTTYFSEDNITDNNVNCPVTLNDIRYDYERGDDCIKRLADYTNYHWYVDYDKDIHFFKGGDETAPFKLTDDSGHGDYGKFAYDSLEIIKDDREIKNVVYVKGGEYLGTSYTHVQEADGDQTAFRTPYKLKNIQVWVDSGGGYVEKTVGVDYLDSFTSYDCLYNYNEKTLKFEDGTQPAAGDLVKTQGDPRLPIITKMESTASQATYGAYEGTIVDKRIKTKEAAKERAQAELDKYMSSLVDAKFKTKYSGLKAGQQIDVDISDRNIDETFIIKSVTFNPRSHKDFYYDVSLISEESMEVIEFFQKMIKKIDSGIEFKEDEQQNTIIDLVKSFDEALTMNEALTVAKVHHAFAETLNSDDDLLRVEINNPPTWVWGPYSPTSDLDRKRPAFFDRLNYYA